MVSMTATKHRVGQQRPGGRAARVRARALSATIDLLEEVGYERLTVDAVAARAGVHKTTVYRRWPTKAELVLDATRELSEQRIPVPDTGTLRGDLQALGRDIVATIGDAAGGRRSRSLVAAAASTPDLAAAMHAFWAGRLAATEPIVERALARGELPATADPNTIIEALIGPLWIRLLLTGEPVDEAFADRIAELVSAGAGAMSV
jgi:AcrR family transcriptional regulator